MRHKLSEYVVLNSKKAKDKRLRKYKNRVQFSLRPADPLPKFNR